MKYSFIALLSLSALLAACENSELPGGQSGGGGGAVNLPAGADRAAAKCLVENPRRDVGAGLDAPGRLEVAIPPLGSSGSCGGGYQLGTGLHDITGMIADTASLAWVNPQQVFSALHSRVYARAFAIGSPCNGRRVMFVSIDTGLMSGAVRNAVLAEIAADPDLAPHYDARNVMLSVTHTHSDPGTGLAGVGNGEAIIVGGITEAIRKAQANLAAQPATANIRLSSGELLNTNLNRSKPAFLMNPEAERRQFLNARGEEVQVNKRMLQLELNRADGRAAGLINWFGVHPTVIGPAQIYVSGDVKGVASLGFEQLMGTDYDADPAVGTFVGAFAQADEGDASPNIFIEERPYPDITRGGGVDELDSNSIAGLKQLARAIELYGSGELLRGPVDYRLMQVPITQITVDDPVVLASLQHPPELDEDIKRTCDGILGASFGAGAEDGPGPTVEGLKCSDDPDVLNAALLDIATLTGARLEGFPGGWPAETIPGQVLSAAVMCNASQLPPALGDFSCQAEKPILLPRGGSVLPFQLFRIGQFALLGLPWEVTTVAARRLREMLLQELAPVGVSTIVIAGLVNDYVHYLTTREEYASQQYEGASNLYGPWSHAVVLQETLKMARELRAGTPLAEAPAVGARSDLSLQSGPSESPHPSGAPGSIISQPPATATPGERISAELVVGHPGNDLRLQQSYVYVERQLAAESWEVILVDRDPNLVYIWKPLVPPDVATERPQTSSGGSAELIWDSPANLAAGVYRFRIEGASRVNGAAEAAPYQAITDTITIGEPVGSCP